MEIKGGQTSHHFAIKEGLNPTNDKFNSSLNDLSSFQRDDSGTTLMYVPCVTVLKPCKCGVKQTLKYVSSIFPPTCPYVASHVHSVSNLKLSDYIFQGTFKGWNTCMLHFWGCDSSYGFSIRNWCWHTPLKCNLPFSHFFPLVSGYYQDLSWYCRYRIILWFCCHDWNAIHLHLGNVNDIF